MRPQSVTIRISLTQNHVYERIMPFPMKEYGARDGVKGGMSRVRVEECSYVEVRTLKAGYV